MINKEFVSGTLAQVLRTLPPLELIEAEKIRRQEQRQNKPTVVKYYDKPSLFTKECIQWQDGESLTDYQYEALDSLVRYKRYSIRGPHGLGKTMIAAILVHWFALTRDGMGVDWKVPTTASSWRQLTKYLWPEIHKWARRIKWDVVGRAPYDTRKELQTLSLKLSNGEAFAVASDVPELIEGAHADQIFYVLDESKSIPAATFDAVEGAFSGGDAQDRSAYALAVSTPGPPVGRFYDIQSHKPGYDDWATRHVTLYEAVNAGRISKKWADQREKQWGKQSAVYKNRVLGEFAESSSDGVIPLAWVEAAVERWHRWKEDDGEIQVLTSIGADLAWGESEHADRVCFAYRMGWVVPQLRVFTRQGTMDTVGRLRGIANRYGGIVVVDVIGAAGVYGRLKEQGTPVLPFNASRKAVRLEDGHEVPLTDRSGELEFLNLRAAAWWRLRELLDPETGVPIALPPDDDEAGITLLQELTTPTWRVNSTGKIQILEKEKIIPLLGRSPDCADAVVDAFALE